MRAPAPFYSWQAHLAIDLPDARALFTTRRGGCSTGPYALLNLGRLTDDEPAAVERNRAALRAMVGAPLAEIRQVHGSEVIRLTEPPNGAGAPPEADGQATALAGVAALVLVADCLPIAVAGQGVVAMLHAGWRGLAAGVVDEGVRSVRELGADGPLTAAIGPGAGPCCYEVGDEVHASFAARHGASARRGGNLDLKAIARAELARAGVGTVHDAGICTICSDPSLLFSHRRDRGITGRQAGVAWLK
ncbi:MAG: polyphenol oxidase family protein [Solirubrobacterales bacterium]|nr:polyphenol oxidase family protein [Solirubrobacterales bacterium]MBV9717099.1 polyphenol oxidase family protein [Solirubrobacterales bacterium]